MQVASAADSKTPHLNQEYLDDLHKSCASKCSESQYKYMLECIEHEVDIITRTMMNSSDHGYGFLKLAIHPGSSPSSMAIIYDKVINQTPWKYKKTAVTFVEAIDTLFKFSTKNIDILKKFQLDNQLFGDTTRLLEALSELTIMYLARLVNQNKTAIAS